MYTDVYISGQGQKAHAKRDGLWVIRSNDEELNHSKYMELVIRFVPPWAVDSPVLPQALKKTARVFCPCCRTGIR